MISSLKNLYLSLSRFAVSLIKRAKMTEHTFMIIMAVIIGALTGYGAMGFKALIEMISGFSYSGDNTLLENIRNAEWYVKLIIPAIGGAIVGPMIYFFAREAKGHGVPEVMQAIMLKGGVIRPRVSIVKALASSITIGTGGSVGREGPIVQIGSSLGSIVGQFYRVSSQRMKTLVGCGAAAGIAATFNAPIAGAFFSVELILRDFGFAQFSPIVISSAIATVISHQYEGNFAAFQVPSYSLISPYELIFYSILGILCGLIAYVFIKSIYGFEDFFSERIPVPEYLQPIIGGIIIGALALYFPDIMGVGYDSVNSALHGKTLWAMALLLVFVKVFATSITLGSGGSGGIFAPSLFLGSMIGCTFGSFVHAYLPGITAEPGAYALVAMGGLVAGTTHAPITAMIIVFELTNDYNIILPLMITCIISTILSSKLSRESVYTLKLLRRNINIKDGTETNVLKSIYIKDVYSSYIETIPEDMRFDDVVNRIIVGDTPYFIVTDKKDQMIGIISLYDIKEHLFEYDMLQNILIANDLARKEVETVTIDDNCQHALDTMSSHNLAGLPVVDKPNSRKILGMVWRKDILDAYNKEIERRDITSSFASKITLKNIGKEVHFMEGYAIAEIPPPKSFIGKSIKELNIRAKYGVDVILIRTNTDQGSKVKAIPNPDLKISFNDSIVVAGEIGKINLLKGLSG